MVILWLLVDILGRIDLSKQCEDVPTVIVESETDV